MTEWLKKQWYGVAGVAWFELRRSFVPSRISLWLLVAFFPMTLMLLVRARTSGEVTTEAIVMIQFFLVVRVACALGLLLWATPLVSNEVEGKTWIYITTRPMGSGGMVLGKYAVAVVWTLSAGLVSALSAVLASGVEGTIRVFSTLALLVVLACFAYGALYTLIGALVQRRAMLVAILYTVVVEGLLSLVPATINSFTIGYRLFSLLVQWMDYHEGAARPNLEYLFEGGSPLYQVSILAILTILMLSAAIYRVSLGGYLTEAEG